MRKPKLVTLHYPIAPCLRDDGPFYLIEDNVVTWRGYELDADPGTFVALSDSWGIDDSAVFVQDTRKKNIDRTTFRLLNPIYEDAVYDRHGSLKNADPLTFEAHDSTYHPCRSFC